MRMVFGLAGLLVTLGVIVWVIVYTMPATEKAVTGVKQQKEVTKQIAGYDTNGLPAGETITLDDLTSGGKTTGAIVTTIKAGGAMERHFGLKRNDTILQIGPLGMQEIGSADAAKDYLVDAFQTNKPIIVMRGEKKITLPIVAEPGATPAAAPAGAKQPAPNKDSVQSQLDAIQKVGH